MTTARILQHEIRETPSALLLHLCVLLTGLATALLGPILPLLSQHWHLQDQQSGTLLLAQFCGAFTGGLTVSKRLRRSLTFGLAVGAVGFAGFAIASGLPVACVSLYAAGWGCGQVITAANIVAGRRYGSRRGSALALLNFSFSFGAMLAPLIAAWLTPHVALRALLLSFAACFTVALAGLLVEFSGQPSELLSVSDVGAAGASSLAFRAYIYFASLLFLYGGIETSLGGWLTTFALRYGDRTLAISEYTTLVFWASLTAGRGLSSLILLRIGERTLQRAGLLLTAACIAGLAVAHGALAIAVFSILLGLSLAPFFPATFSLLMSNRPSARQAGVVLSMSGIGAAILPALMGIVSTHSGSLQFALVIPLAAAVVLLGLSLIPPSPGLAKGIQSGT